MSLITRISFDTIDNVVETDIIDSIAVSLITRTSFDTSDNVYGDLCYVLISNSVMYLMSHWVIQPSM